MNDFFSKPLKRSKSALMLVVRNHLISSFLDDLQGLLAMFGSGPLSPSS